MLWNLSLEAFKKRLGRHSAFVSVGGGGCLEKGLETFSEQQAEIMQFGPKWAGAFDTDAESPPYNQYIDFSGWTELLGGPDPAYGSGFQPFLVGDYFLN